ncbi:MAG: hypothetical protein COA88_07605 [Kordia sp.]|nr:MAG: hypothetical protein COA88_07605 [Kordia sp.]
MKFTTIKTTKLFILFIAVTIFSCSSDDDASSCTETLWYADADSDGLGDPNVSISSCTQPDGYVSNSDDDFDGIIADVIHNYFTLSLGNEWVYDVTTDDGTNPPTDTVDEILVDETTIIDTNEYFGMSSSAGSSGVMTQLYDQNYFRAQNGITYMKGDFTLPLSAFGGTDIVINLDDTKLIDESKSAGTILSTQSGDTTQNIGGFDLDITYTFKTVQQGTLATHTVGSETFNDIIKSDIVLSIKVTTEINVGVPITITLIDTQDVLTINNYYAANIGLIDSKSTTTYTLEDLSALPVTIPIPETATIITDQEITSYTIN